MNFDELVQETLVIVKRPDLLDQIQRAVRAATLKAHTKDFYYRDIVETGVQFSVPKSRVSFEPKQLFPRFRKEKYIRVFNYDSEDEDFGRPGDYLKIANIGNLQDAYGYDKENIFYMAGNYLQLRYRCALSHILFGYYQYPDINADSFDSWIAQEFPAAIYREAARSIFKSIGFDEQAAEQNNLVSEEYQILVINNIAEPGE